MVLGVAAAAFERWRRLKEVPQSLAADLTVGWKMIEREDKLVAPVADEGAAITMWHGFQWSILFMPDVVFTVILDQGRQEGKSNIYDLLEADGLTEDRIPHES